MESTVELPRKPQRIQDRRINYALAATLIAQGEDVGSVAAKCGAKNAHTLRVGLNKRGVKVKEARALPMTPARNQTTVARLATQAVDIIRDRLNEELIEQVDSLAGRKVNYADLASKGQGRAAMVKTIAESFRALNGGAEMNVLVFGVGSMESSPGDRQPVIDVEQVNPEPSDHNQ